MGEYVARIRNKISGWMQGRYGLDAFSMALVVIGLVLSLVAMFTGFEILSYLSLILLAYVVFRMVSKNIAQRTKELNTYNGIIEKPKKWLGLTQKKWSNRKTTTYFTCEECGATLSVPKGKGTLRTTCPKCHHQATRKS